MQTDDSLSNSESKHSPRTMRKYMMDQKNRRKNQGQKDQRIKILKSKARIKVNAEIIHLYHHNKSNNNSYYYLIIYINSHENVYNQCTY